LAATHSTTAKDGIAAGRKQAGWNNEYLLKVLPNWIACPELERCVAEAVPVVPSHSGRGTPSTGPGPAAGIVACQGAAGTVPKGRSRPRR